MEAGTLDKIDDTSGKINPYHEITNKVEKDDTIISQMKNKVVNS